MKVFRSLYFSNYDGTPRWGEKKDSIKNDFDWLFDYDLEQSKGKEEQYRINCYNDVVGFICNIPCYGTFYENVLSIRQLWEGDNDIAYTIRRRAETYARLMGWQINVHSKLGQKTVKLTFYKVCES